ncbi:MAG TPA: flagellar biosynthetic protein FliR [Verrucomicrobiae bacterium]|jgi:flagellar biosynthetic protein FliR
MQFDLTIWLLVFLRASALLVIFPLFSIQNFPVQLRLAVGAILACLLTPLLPGLVSTPHSLVGLILLMAREVAIGLLLGFVTRFIFYILEFAGNLIASEIGLNMAATLNPFTHLRSDIPGMTLYYLGALLFLTLDLHHALLIAFQRAYTVLPIGGGHLTSGLFSHFIGITSNLFVVGLLIAAPIIAVSFLINLVFSVLGRAVPQMNVFSESFSFRILAGLSVFGLSLTLMAQHVANYLQRLPDDFLRVAQLMAGT